MRILLLGRNGQVGWELQRALAPLGEITAPGRESRDGLHGDLAQPETLADTIRSLRPALIVNAAAYTEVDKAESDPGPARRVNAEAPGVLARAARETGAWLVHYSTDYVFSGAGEAPWQETDPPDPVNAYGAAKLAGEQAVRESGCRHLLFRTSWVYAARGGNFLLTMLRLAAERSALRVIHDQSGAPTGADLIADVTAHAVRHALQRPESAGTYHLAAAGETNWYDYARFLIESARAAGFPVRVADAAITPVTSAEFQTPAARPHNSRLNCDRLEQTFGLKMPDWRDGVSRTLAEILTARDQVPAAGPPAS